MNTLYRVPAAQHHEDRDLGGVALMSLQEELTGPIRPAVAVLTCSVVFILLLCCANIAGMPFCARGARADELFIRVAPCGRDDQAIAFEKFSFALRQVPPDTTLTEYVKQDAIARQHHEFTPLIRPSRAADQKFPFITIPDSLCPLEKALCSGTTASNPHASFSNGCTDSKTEGIVIAIC
jgi:hypothetical protein